MRDPAKQVQIKRLELAIAEYDMQLFRKQENIDRIQAEIIEIELNKEQKEDLLKELTEKE